MSSKNDFYTTLRTYFGWVFPVIAITIGFLRSIADFESLFASDAIHAILVIILLLVTIAWFLGWFFFDERELKFLENNIKVKDIDKDEVWPFIQIALIAILCGALLSMLAKIEIYLILVIMNYFIASSAYHVVRTSLEAVYVSNYHDPDSKIREYCEYYFHRPFSALDNATIIYLFIGLFSFFQYQSSQEVIYLYASYIVGITGIFIHELILWRWRIARDRQIKSMSS